MPFGGHEYLKSSKTRHQATFAAYFLKEQYIFLIFRCHEFPKKSEQCENGFFVILKYRNANNIYHSS